jgi:hypothetical protein
LSFLLSSKHLFEIEKYNSFSILSLLLDVVLRTNVWSVENDSSYKKVCLLYNYFFFLKKNVLYCPFCDCYKSNCLKNKMNLFQIINIFNIFSY